MSVTPEMSVTQYSGISNYYILCRLHSEEHYSDSINESCELSTNAGRSALESWGC
jgi:hypothetical protein